MSDGLILCQMFSYCFRWSYIVPDGLILCQMVSYCEKSSRIVSDGLILCQMVCGKCLLSWMGSEGHKNM